MAVTMEIIQEADLGHRYLPLASIEISKTNPRKHFDKAKLAELTESILRHGVLQPILVRPKGDRYELVAGERRFRATKDAAIAEIPAIVRNLDDKQVLEVQVIENLQRADLHALEEAEGYERLIKEHGYDADSLAEKIGKSRSYVYARMKLTALCKPAREALWNDTITHSVALLIARIPDESLQKDALAEVSRPHYGGEPMPYRTAADYIQHTFMLRLAEAPFDRGDAMLVPAAGPCTKCPMRTGNQKELFGEVKNADLCTAPTCFEKKVNAFIARETAAAKERGQQVLDAATAKKIFPYAGMDYAQESSGYVMKTEKPWSDKKKRTYGQIVGDAVETSLAFHEGKRKFFEVYPMKDVKNVLKEKDVELDRWTHSSRGSANADRRYAEEGRIKRLIETATLDAITAKVESQKSKMKADPFVFKLLRVFAAAIAHSKSYAIDKILVRHGEKKVDYKTRPRLTRKLVDAMADAQLPALIAECLFTFGTYEQRSKAEEDLAGEFCKLIGLDRGAIAKRVRAEISAKKRAKKIPAKSTKKSTKRGASS